MKRISRFLAVTFAAAWLSSLACASDGSRIIPINSISSVIKSYISAEEKQDYGRVYSLLGLRLREQLRRENAVMDVKDYKRLRQSSEARWFGFSETERNVAGMEATLTFSATVEESGEKEQVQVTLKLVTQAGKWRIDDIKY